MKFLFYTAALCAWMFSVCVATGVSPEQGDGSGNITGSMTFQEAMDNPDAGNLPVDDCDEELMDCLKDTMSVASSAGYFDFDRDDSSSWAPFDTWERLCGSVNAEFSNVKCMMCATEKYPSIHQECDTENRRLAKNTWKLFDGFKEHRRRRHLQNTSSDDRKAKKVDEKGGKRLRHRHHRRQEETYIYDDQAAAQSKPFQPRIDSRFLPTCPLSKETPGYSPEDPATAYFLLVGPLLLPVVLDVSEIDLGAIEFDTDEDAVTTDIPDDPDGITGLSAILTTFEERTNQELVASTIVVGAALEFLAPIVESICQVIPDPVCFALCASTPLRAACFIIHGIILVVIQVYKFFQVGIELHDGVVDGAEILATLRNSETLIDGACQLSSDVSDLSTQVGTETDEIDAALVALSTQVDNVANEIYSRFDRTDALLEVIRRLLITPPGQRPGYNDEESCQNEADCPIPPTLPIP